MLVLGGPHDVSARVRDEVMAHGGRVAVNLTPAVSHLIVLGVADTDIRYPRTAHLLWLDPVTLLIEPGIPATAPSQPDTPLVPEYRTDAAVDRAGAAPDPVPFPATRILGRGEVTDLPDESSWFCWKPGGYAASPAGELV